MRIRITSRLVSFLAASLWFSAIAHGQEPSAQRSEAESPGAREPVEFGVDNFEVKPHAGAIFFNGNERFAGGLLTGFDVVDVAAGSAGRFTVGPEIGAIYSSTSGNDFFSGVGVNNSDYIFQLPGNLRASFVPSILNERMHVGAHGGVNVIRSTGTVARGGAFGDAGAVPGAGASWDARPNVGGEVGYEVVQGLDVSIRPDITFLPDFNLVTTTLGLGLRL